MRDDRVYLDNILECIRRIEDYTQGSWELFAQSMVIQDAVIRNFEVISEATKRISQDLRDANPVIPWRRMAGFRDVLIHDYLNLNLNLIWKTVEEDLPNLKSQIRALLQSLEADDAPPPAD